MANEDEKILIGKIAQLEKSLYGVFVWKSIIPRSILVHDLYRNEVYIVNF